MEWNLETVLDALNDFERKPELNPTLEEYLQHIAKNGEIVFPWNKLKPLLKKKLEIVLDEFYETCPVETSAPVPNFETFNFDNLKKTILQALDTFTSAPFTIQRLCELVTNPQKHYNRTDKYMRGIEKNVLVVSTIEPRSGGQDNNNVNNNVIVNGMVNDSPHEDNDTLNGHENKGSDSVSSSNVNISPCHVLLENFANVFPSAACIPSASSMCINRDIDSNFISSSDNVDSPDDVEFESSASTSEESESKEEAMDITENSEFRVVQVEVEEKASDDESLESKIKDNIEEDVTNIEAQCDSNTPEADCSDIKDTESDVDCSDIKDNESEADSSSESEKFQPIEQEKSYPAVGTVSQSDDTSSELELVESDEVIDEPVDEIESSEVTDSSGEHDKADSPVPENFSEVSNSVEDCEAESTRL